MYTHFHTYIFICLHFHMYMHIYIHQNVDLLVSDIYGKGFVKGQKYKSHFATIEFCQTINRRTMNGFLPKQRQFFVTLMCHFFPTSKNKTKKSFHQYRMCRNIHWCSDTKLVLLSLYIQKNTQVIFRSCYLTKNMHKLYEH